MPIGGQLCNPARITRIVRYSHHDDDELFPVHDDDDRMMMMMMTIIFVMIAMLIIMTSYLISSSGLPGLLDNCTAIIIIAIIMQMTKGFC